MPAGRRAFQYWTPICNTLAQETARLVGNLITVPIRLVFLFFQGLMCLLALLNIVPSIQIIFQSSRPSVNGEDPIKPVRQLSRLEGLFQLVSCVGVLVFLGPVLLLNLVGLFQELHP